MPEQVTTTPQAAGGRAQGTGHVCRLTDAQVTALLRAIDVDRVMSKEGNAYIAAWDGIRWLNRIFGIGFWDLTTEETHLVREHTWQDGMKKKRDGTQAPNMRHTVVYRSRVRLTIRCPYCHGVLTVQDGSAVADQSNIPDYGDAHHNALTSAESLATRRAMKQLGDQFGLGLYNKGSVRPVVLGMIPYGVGTPDDHRDEAVRGDDVPGEDTPPPAPAAPEQPAAVSHDTRPAPVSSDTREPTVTPGIPYADLLGEARTALRRLAVDAGISVEDLEMTFAEWRGYPLDQATAPDLAHMRAVLTGTTHEESATA